MITFADFPLWLNIATFIVAAVAVWVAGTRLSRYADGIAREFGIGQAVLGVILLGGVTSLPEIAVTGTAAPSAAMRHWRSITFWAGSPCRSRCWRWPIWRSADTR